MCAITYLELGQGLESLRVLLLATVHCIAPHIVERTAAEELEAGLMLLMVYAWHLYKVLSRNVYFTIHFICHAHRLLSKVNTRTIDLDRVHLV